MDIIHFKLLYVPHTIIEEGHYASIIRNIHYYVVTNKITYLESDSHRALLFCFLDNIITRTKFTASFSALSQLFIVAAFPSLCQFLHVLQVVSIHNATFMAFGLATLHFCSS